MKSSVILATATAVFCGSLHAATPIQLTTFTAGTPARAAEVNGNFAALRTALRDSQQEIQELQEQLAGLQEQLTNVMALNSVLKVETRTPVPTVVLTGVNLQVVNGTGLTTKANGAGNVIIGYDEAIGPASLGVCSIGKNENNEWLDDAAKCTAAGGVFAASHKSGSHYLVLGQFNNYASAGGIVAGQYNTSSALFASALGGFLNQSGGFASVVMGGSSGTAIGSVATIAGGRRNLALANEATVSGGRFNIASGEGSSALGGDSNIASGAAAIVVGGNQNVAGEIYTSVVGGFSNQTLFNSTTILGGEFEKTTATRQTIVGTP